LIMSGAYGKGARIVEAIPSASYSMTLRVEMPNQAESLDAILTAVGAADGMVGAVDIVRMQGETRSVAEKLGFGRRIWR